MSGLAERETALWQDRAYARLADSHLHRAVREDSLGLIKGRDGLIAAWVAEDAHPVTIDHDLGDMIACTVAGRGRLHRWIERQGDRIVRETVVEAFGGLKTAPPVHPPLGELRSGRGQFAAGAQAIVPPDFSDGARALADRLHAAWNGRAFDLHGPDWLVTLCRQLPDATFTFARALVSETTTALLWRAHGHDANGARVRLIGSSVFMGDVEDTLIDHAALTAQLAAPLIDYGAG